jgi:hypothetical protein
MYLIVQELLRINGIKFQYYVSGGKGEFNDLEKIWHFLPPGNFSAFSASIVDVCNLSMELQPKGYHNIILLVAIVNDSGRLSPKDLFVCHSSTTECFLYVLDKRCIYSLRLRPVIRIRADQGHSLQTG